jgi:hypothetical protein
LFIDAPAYRAADKRSTEQSRSSNSASRFFHTVTSRCFCSISFFCQPGIVHLRCRRLAILSERRVGAHFALGVVCRLAGCRPVQPNRRGPAKDQVHSDEKAEDHVTLTHRTREKEHCSNQQSETGK